MKFLYSLLLSMLLTGIACSQDTPVPATAPAPAPTPAPTPAPAADDNPVCIVKTSKGDIHIRLFADEAPKTVENFIGLAEGTKEFTSDPETQKKVTRPFYDGLIFHRVIKNFMIQGGCPLGTGTGGPGYKFEDEISAEALGLDKIKALDEKTGPHKWLFIRNRAGFQRMLLGPLLNAMGIKDEKTLKGRMEDVQKRLKTLTLKEAYENLGYKFDSTRTSHHPKRGVLAMANSGPQTNGSQFFINLIDTPWLTGKHTVFGETVKGMDVIDKIGNVEVSRQGNKPVEDVKVLSIRLQWDANAYLWRGKGYSGKQQHDKAIADFTKALELAPARAAAYECRAAAYCAAKQYDKAWNDVKKGKALGHTFNAEFLKKLRDASGKTE